MLLGGGLTATAPCWVDIAARVLGHTRPDLDLRLVDASRAGDTVRDLEARLAAVLTPAPAWVAVCPGATDFLPGPDGASAVPLADFATRYAGLLAHIRAAGAGAIAVTIPVVGLESETGAVPDPGAYNTAIRAAATGEDARLVDPYRAFRAIYERAADYKQHVSLTSDGIHPNPQGVTLFTRTLLLELGLLPE